MGIGLFALGFGTLCALVAAFGSFENDSKIQETANYKKIYQSINTKELNF